MTPSNVEQQLHNIGLPFKSGGRRVFKNDPSEKGDWSAEALNQWLPRWARNAARNYPIVSRSWGVGTLYKSAVDIPAVVVGIGPSLDQSYADLKMAEGRSIIIATDAAYRCLLANNIKPTLVMTLDAKKEQSSLWSTVETARVPLIANSCTHPQTISSWGGPIVFFNMFLWQNDFIRSLLPCIYPKLGKIDSLGTVGNMAILLAEGLGCDPIITVGMDLCYGKNGEAWRYRCKDVCYQTDQWGKSGKWVETENKLYENNARLANSFEETVGKNVYRVDPELRGYRNGLITHIGEKHLPVIDCSPGGVLREFINHMELAEAIAANCKEDLGPARTILTSLYKICPNPKDAIEWTEANED